MHPAANSKSCLYFKINTTIKAFPLSLLKMQIFSFKNILAHRQLFLAVTLSQANDRFPMHEKSQGLKKPPDCCVLWPGQVTGTGGCVGVIGLGGAGWWLGLILKVFSSQNDWDPMSSACCKQSLHFVIKTLTEIPPGINEQRKMRESPPRRNAFFLMIVISRKAGNFCKFSHLSGHAFWQGQP